MTSPQAKPHPARDTTRNAIQEIDDGRVLLSAQVYMASSLCSSTRCLDFFVWSPSSQEYVRSMHSQSRAKAVPGRTFKNNNTQGGMLRFIESGFAPDQSCLAAHQCSSPQAAASMYKSFAVPAPFLSCTDNLCLLRGNTERKSPLETSSRDSNGMRAQPS